LKLDAKRKPALATAIREKRKSRKWSRKGVGKTSGAERKRHIKKYKAAGKSCERDGAKKSRLKGSGHETGTIGRSKTQKKRKL